MYFNQVEFGKRIRELRRKVGLTQEQLSEELNISVEQLRKMECGTRTTSLEGLISLAMYFDVSTDYRDRRVSVPYISDKEEYEMPETIIRPYEEKMVNSALLEIPRNTYQRGLNPERVKRISHSFYDLWRVENGKIAEHWDVMETIADKDTWQNRNGKF